MKKTRTHYSSERVFYPFKIPNLKPGSTETALTERQTNQIQSSSIDESMKSSSFNLQTFPNNNEDSLNKVSNSKKEIIDIIEEKNSIKWTETISYKSSQDQDTPENQQRSSSNQQDDPSNEQILQLSNPQIQSNINQSESEIDNDKREFEEILYSFCNVQTRQGKLQLEEEFKGFIQNVSENQHDYFQMKILLDETQRQISSNKNQLNHIEMRNLQAKKSALELLIDKLQQKKIWKSEHAIQKTKIQNSIPFSSLGNGNTFTLSNSEQKQGSLKPISVTEFQLGTQTCNSKKKATSECQINQISEALHLEKVENNISRLTSKQYESLVLDQEKQVEFYNKKYNINQLNSFFTSATTKMISLQESEFLEDELNKLLKDKNSADWQMLNIPCGNGRLNGLFSNFVSCIDCVDPCQIACSFVKQQKKYEIKKSKIGLISTKSIQKFVFEPKKKYHLIWCNYGYSFLNSIEAQEFLIKARDNLQYDGYLIIKDVVTDSKEIILNTEEQRVFRSTQQYSQELGAHFEICKMEFFYPTSADGASYRPEVIFFLQVFPRTSMKWRKSSK